MPTPIATKSFGTDSEYQLEKVLQVWKIVQDAKTEIITVIYDIVLMSPNGKIVSVLETNAYTRSNMPLNPKFDALRESDIGQGEVFLINKDLNMINSFVTLKEDLKQLNVPPVEE